MPRELKNATITHVSYVDKAANQRKFFLTKAASGKPVFEKQVRILTKAEDEQKLVYGVVYEPDVIDSQGDFMTADSIEKAAHGFMKEAQNIDKQHNFESGFGDVVESYVAPADFTVGEQTITKGSWVLVTKATDEIWDDIKKGDITGYSMAGTAETEEVAKQEDEEQKSFFKAMKAFFLGPQTEIAKGEVTDAFLATKKARDFWAARDIFDSIVWEEFWNVREGRKFDGQRMIDAASEFVTLLQAIAADAVIIKAVADAMPEGIEKAGKKISAARLTEIKSAFDVLGKVISEVEEVEVEKEEEHEMKPEDIQKMLDDALAPINAKLTDLEKGESNPAPSEGEKAPATEEVVQALDSALQKALQPISDRLEAVEKARGIKKSVEGEGNPTPEDVKKSESVFGSMFRL